ncbi:MAG: hypothetical protein M1815_003635 [Lichina confinis]|nr:MAG: hypothetical protein M1815_003635 [Lichina confinis]
MGRQNYITLLALGRSAYEEPDIDAQLHRSRVQVLAAEDDSRQDSQREAAASGRYVQLYDSRGHPVNHASRALTRRLIRAQNDVLATIGVCVANPQSNTITIQRSGTTIVSPEDGDFIDGLDCTSATGLGLLASDFALLFLATWWNAGVRYRLQAFPWLAGKNIFRTIRSDVQALGWKRFFLGGLSSSTIQVFSSIGRDGAISLLHRFLYMQLAYNEKSLKRRKRWNTLLGYLDRGLMMAWFIHLAPFGAWSMLQHLGLIAPYAPIPTRDFCAWFFSMPGYEQASLWTAFTQQSWTNLALALLRWPLFWFFANSMSKFVLDYFLFTKIRRCFVKWVDAEAAHARMAVHGGSRRTTRLLENGGGVQSRAVDWWTATRGWLIRKLFYRPVSTSELFSRVHSEQQQQQQRQTHSLIPLAPSLALEVTETTMAADATASTDQPNAAGGDASQQPMANPEDGDHPGSAMLEVEVSRARQALTDTATSPNSNPNVGGATLQHHAQPRPGTLDPPVCVSTYPVLSYSSRISETIATLLTLPLETYMAGKDITLESNYSKGPLRVFALYISVQMQDQQQPLMILHKDIHSFAAQDRRSKLSQGQ